MSQALRPRAGPRRQARVPPYCEYDAPGRQSGLRYTAAPTRWGFVCSSNKTASGCNVSWPRTRPDASGALNKQSWNHNARSGEDQERARRPPPSARNRRPHCPPPFLRDAEIQEGGSHHPLPTGPNLHLELSIESESEHYYQNSGTVIIFQGPDLVAWFLY